VKTILKLEQLGLFLLSLLLFSRLGAAWWIYPVLFLAPDLAMLGYLAGPKVGAATYNLAHHQGLAAALYAVGVLSSLPVIALAGVIVLGHSSLDRVFGYGLKYPDAFHHTHLGWIGGRMAAPAARSQANARLAGLSGGAREVEAGERSGGRVVLE